MMRTALGLFYREILQRNLENIPSKGPVLLIANHPSSLMDAALLGILFKRPINFFARGDIFINPLVCKILNALHMYPVFNHSEGRQTLGANDETFEKAVELLLNGQIVLFFPEGLSHTEYRLWNFRKGAFRIALQILQKNPSLRLPIVPLGINYSHPTKLFSRVWVQAGPSILTNDLLPTYLTQPALALKQLTSQAYNSIKELVVDCPAESTESLFRILEIYRNSTQQKASATDDIITSELQINRQFIDWQKPSIEQLSGYRHALNNADVSDAAIAASNSTRFSTLPLVIGFPAAFIGWLLNGFPLLLARKITDQKVKRDDFYGWILVTSSALMYIIWFILISLLAFIFLPGWEAIAFLFVMVATGQYCWNYLAYYLKWKTQQEGLALNPATRESLIAQRQTVMASIISPS